MTIAQNRLMTLGEYLEYDDGTDTCYELIDGILVEMAPENPLNNTIVVFLIVQFSQTGIEHYRLATDHGIQVGSKTASSRIPDLIVHSEASASAILQDGRLLRLGHPAPDLVIEIVSSSDTDKRSRDRNYVLKRREYALRSIQEHWIIDPEASCVVIHTLTDNNYAEKTYVDQQPLISSVVSNTELTARKVLTAGIPR